MNTLDIALIIMDIVVIPYITTACLNKLYLVFDVTFGSAMVFGLTGIRKRIMGCCISSMLKLKPMVSYHTYRINKQGIVFILLFSKISLLEHMKLHTKVLRFVL